VSVIFIVPDTPTIHTTPYTPPDGFIVAATVGEIFDVVYSPFMSHIAYSVGEPPIAQFPCKIRNRAVTNTIRVKVELPDYLSTSTVDFVIAPSETTLVTITLNESVVKNKSQSTIKQFVGEIAFLISPENVNAPILVPDSLPPLVL
jgi:hypothetical protein